MQTTSGEAIVIATMQSDITIPFKHGSVQAHLTLPEGSGKYPGLVLIEEIWGVNDHIKDVANRLSKEGFIVLSPELLPGDMLEKMTPQFNKDLFDPQKRHDMQPLLREAMAPINSPSFSKETIEKLQACVDYLIAHGQGNGKVGSIGFCFGGSYSLELAIHEKRLDSCVVFYGQVPEPVSEVKPIACPVLMFTGEKDEHIVASLPKLDAAMKEYGKNFESIVYSDVGHAFFNDTNDRAYNATVASQAWHKSLTFLHKYLET